jgi:hypothetical protein
MKSRCGLLTKRCDPAGNRYDNGKQQTHNAAFYRTRSCGLLPATELPAAEHQKAPPISDPVSLYRDDDLAKVSARAKMTTGFARFTELIRSVDHGDQMSGFKTFVQI